jgi:hypothetical protein
MKQSENTSKPFWKNKINDKYGLQIDGGIVVDSRNNLSPKK